jgi:hypothetical protein
MKTYETFLPIFTGFYGTIFEPYALEDSHADRPAFCKIEPEYDYSDFYASKPREITGAVESLLSDFVYSIEFQALRSPEYYNFSNDSINVAIQPKVKVIRKYVNNHWADFEKWIKDRYTSCSGFWSHYSNNANDWKAETNNFYDFSADKHKLGAILDFIADTEISDPTEALYYGADNNGYSVIPHYPEYEESIEAVKTFTQNNYQHLPTEVPTELEELNEKIDVLAAIQHYAKQIDRQTPELF